MPSLVRYIKTVSLGVWLFSSQPGAAQSTSAKIDLSAFLANSSLNPQDVYQVGSLYGFAGAGFSRASFGDADPAWFVVQSSYEPQALVKKGLRIRFNIFGFDVESCQPDACQIVQRSTEKSSRLTVEGLKITVQLSGFPCGKKPTCTYFLPSWSVAQMARSGGSVSGIPNVLSYVQHRGGLTLFNMETQQRWLDLFGDGVPAAYGLLQQLSQLGDTVLLLRFENAFLALDLAQDQAFLADHNGLFKSIHGLSFLNDESFVLVLSQAPNQSPLRAPIAFTRELVAWPDLTILWRKNWQVNPSPLLHPEIFFAAEPQAPDLMRYLALNEGELKTWDLRLSDGSIVQFGATQNISASSAQDLFLQRGRVLLRQDTGISLLKGDAKLPSSLSGQKSENVRAMAGDFYIQQGAGASCLWRHYRGHKEIAESFQESGLQSRCTKLQNFNSTAKAASITNFDGRFLTFKALLQ